jgi:hypothetical protein
MQEGGGGIPGFEGVLSAITGETSPQTAASTAASSIFGGGGSTGGGSIFGGGGSPGGGGSDLGLFETLTGLFSSKRRRRFGPASGPLQREAPVRPLRRRPLPRRRQIQGRRRPRPFAPSRRIRTKRQTRLQGNIIR